MIQDDNRIVDSFYFYYPLIQSHLILSNLTQSNLIPGNTAVAVAIDGCYVGTIGIADEIKHDAAETVEHMHRMGLDV